MNSSSKDAADEANKQQMSPADLKGESTTQTNWFGPFSLPRSPLFFVITILIVLMTILAAKYTQNLEMSILSGMVIELLAIVVIWQYLQISRRIDDLTNRTASLQNFATVAEQMSNSEKAAHGYTHRMLGTMSGDQSRILQSSEELKKAVKLLCDHIEGFFTHIEHWQSQDLEILSEVKQSLTSLKSETIEDWQKQNLEHLSEITQSLASLKSETIEDWQKQNLEQLGEITRSLATLKGEAIEDWQKQNQKHLGEITQSLANLKSKTLGDWQKQNFKHLGEITQSLETLKNVTSNEFGLTRESLRDSNQNAVSEAHNKLAELVSDTEQRQQQTQELLINDQITKLLEKTNAAQTNLKASMAGQVQESLKDLQESLTADLSEKTALAFD